MDQRARIPEQSAHAAVRLKLRLCRCSPHGGSAKARQQLASLCVCYCMHLVVAILYLLVPREGGWGSHVP